jgi:hypothetical protein
MDGCASKAKKSPIVLSGISSPGVSHDAGSDDIEIQEERLYGIGGLMGNGVAAMVGRPGGQIAPSDILAKGIVTVDSDNGQDMNPPNFGVTSAIESPSVSSALSSFRFAWGTSGELLVHDGLNEWIARSAPAWPLALALR